MNENEKKAVVYCMGTLDGIHQAIWKLREGKDEETTRDLDSAQVFVEAAFEKLQLTLDR